MATAAAPQSGFDTGAVVVVAEPDGDGDWILDTAQEIVFAVPPTERIRTTSPNSEAAAHANSATMTKTILFTSTLNSHLMVQDAADLTENTTVSAPLVQSIARTRARRRRYSRRGTDVAREH